MNRRNINNRGVYNEQQNNDSGSNVYNAGGSISIDQSSSGLSIQEFQSLLNQIHVHLQTVNIAKSERQDIEAIVTQVLKQTQKKEPKKSLIVGPLQTAFDLIIQAGGAATAAASLAQLMQKAISYAQSLF